MTAASEAPARRRSRRRSAVRAPAQRHRRLGHDRSLRDVQHDGAGRHAHLRGLRSRVSSRREQPEAAWSRLDLDASLLGEQPAFNTIGMIKGTEKPNEYVMLSAHFDSWDGSSGATDNGTGTMMAMEAMRILKQAYPHPKRTILVGHWASEEQGLNGSTRVHRGSSGSHEGTAGAVQPGQRHRPRAVAHRVRACRTSGAISSRGTRSCRRSTPTA